MKPSPPPLASGLLLVLSAPSGAGKTTLARRLVQDAGDAIFSVSYTTRPPRVNEKDAVDYHFVDVGTFHEKIKRGEFVEWAEVHGHFYGSPRSVVEEALARKVMAIFDIDVQGGNAIKAAYPQAVLLFVLPPSLKELERRLRERNTEPEAIIQARLLGARSEIEKGIDSYEYFIINENLSQAYGELQAIVTAERSRKMRFDFSRLQLDWMPGKSRKGKN
jgi:guanylate kinase